VFFKDGSKTLLSEVNYPLGHRKRRKEGVPAVMRKFNANTAMVYAPKQRDAIVAACTNQKKLEAMAVDEFVDLLVR
jgi:2-methylcitrate dehydratase